MKHLFFIHSQITYLVSNKIINFLKINPEDCIFIMHRVKTDAYKQIGIKRMNFPFNSSSFPVFNKFWKSWSNIDKLDAYIYDVTNNHKFLFYTPHTYLKFLALIVSHKNCTGFNIIEEGLASYIEKENLNNVLPAYYYTSIYTRFLWKLNYINRLSIKRPFINEKYIKAYGLTQHSFPSLSRKEVLGLPNSNDYNLTNFNIHFGNSDENIFYKNILVFDSLVEIGELDSGTLLLSTLILLNYLIDKGEKILFVKYHPDQLRIGKSIELLKELFKQTNKIEVIEISPNISLEEVALKQDAEFYVFLSSVGLYASFYGRKVNSLCKIAEKLYPSFSNKINNTPAIFKDNINLLSIL